MTAHDPGFDEGQPWPLLAPPATAPVEPLPVAPTCSVVIAAHQAADTVADAVESVLRQTAPPLEIVVCDDGSTDGTHAVLDRYAGRVHVVRQANRGEGAAKNAAVRAARGEFVAVLDADDLFLPRRLEALAWATRRRPDLDVVVTDAVLEVGGAAVGRAYHEGWPFPVHDQRAAILSRNFVLGLAAVRRSRWLAAGGFDEGLHRTTDWDFFLRLVLGGARIGLVDVPLARYRLHQAGLSSARQDLVRARIQVLERAARRADLSAGEREVVRHALGTQRRELRRRQARDALCATPAGSTTARPSVRRLAAAALLAGAPAAAEGVGLAAAVIAPRWAARRWTARSAGVEVGAGHVLPTSTSAPSGAAVAGVHRPAAGDGVAGVAASHDAGVDEQRSDGGRAWWLRGVTTRRGGLPLRLPVLRSGLVGALELPVADVCPEGVRLDRTPADLAAARLRRAGVEPRWTDPVVVPDRGALVRHARATGRTAAAAVRPDELSWSRVGSWWQGTVGQRLLRRLPAAHLLPLPARRLEDIAFWQGVRAGCTANRWAALTRSYVCLAYHRVAGELRPGEERYDVAPRRFARNATLLRLMRWRPLDVAEIAAVHRGTAVLPRRRFVLTLDDGYADAVAAATAHADLRPHLYVPTAEVADRPAWAGGAALADWDDLAAATAAGARVGVHGRVHRPLTELPPARVADELTQALTELRGHLPAAVPMLAYPNGRHDATVREAAIAGGYLAAWTTMTGRNGPGADPYCLRRVSVKDWDGPLSFMWKVVSGQNVPPPLEVVTRSWWRRRAGRRGVRRAVDPT